MKDYVEKELLQQVPLDYEHPLKSSITLFARDIFDKKNENAEILVYFNGGPGVSCIRDWRETEWVVEALKTYRVILLDQRGTGRSQPVDLNILSTFKSSESLYQYLTYFRADNIVRDTEFLRTHSLKRAKITIFGQSFGGFVVFSYLSMAPKALRGALITAGIPPLTCNSVEAVYQALITTIEKRNEKFYQAYPQDKIKVERIVTLIQQAPMSINGELLTLERFLDLGWYFGHEEGFETIHHLLDEAFCDEKMTQLSWRFAKNILQMTSFWEMNPLYALLHESIYCYGFGSHWAAEKVKQQIQSFNLKNKLPYFSGEMVRSTMLQDYAGLTAFEEAANLLAQKNDWPLLYDMAVLAKNTVPVEALLMTDDFYVNYDLAKTAASRIKNIKLWQHKTWQHDALRKHGKKVMSTLLKRLDKRII